MRGPLEDPVMAGFVAQREAVNAAADSAAGFVWRLQTEEGDATAIRVFEDPRILVKMSVWESVESLRQYVYRSLHAEPFRDRAAWFQKYEDPQLVLWWIPSGKTPTVEEAAIKLELLGERGPTQKAFTFKSLFHFPGIEVRAHCLPMNRTRITIRPVRAAA
jgi:hypothetical protein